MRRRARDGRVQRVRTHAPVAPGCTARGQRRIAALDHLTTASPVRSRIDTTSTTSTSTSTTSTSTTSTSTNRPGGASYRTVGSWPGGFQGEATVIAGGSTTFGVVGPSASAPVPTCTSP